MNKSFDDDVFHMIQEVFNSNQFKSNTNLWVQYGLKNNRGHNEITPSENFMPEEQTQVLLAIKETRLALLYKSSSLPTEKDLFVRNMTGNMWLYLAGVLILLTLCLRLSTHTHHMLKPRHVDWSWAEIMQWTLGAVCQQGSAKHPQGCSCRTMFMIGYLITYMIYTGYAAGITSLLAIRTDAQPVPWHKAISLDLPFTTLCESEGEVYLKNRELTKQGGKVSKCLNTIDQLVTTVMGSDAIAVVPEDIVQRYLMENVSSEERCMMSITKQAHASSYDQYPIKGNNTLKQKLNSYWLLRYKEHGLLKELNTESERFSICEMSPGYTEVGFEHVKSAFLILFLHMILALLIFVTEVILGRARKITNDV